MIHAATCATCADGLAIITIMGGPSAPFEFRYRRITPTITEWSTWEIGEGTTARTKTISGLTPGTYQVEIDRDLQQGMPHTCTSIRTFIIENGDTCSDSCSGDSDKCENALEYTYGGLQYPSEMVEHVVFNHIPEYNIGESELTVEMWVKPNPIIEEGSILFSWDTEMPVFFNNGTPVNGDFGGFTLRLMPHIPNYTSLHLAVNKHSNNDYNDNGHTAFKVSTVNALNMDPVNFNHIVFVLKKFPDTSEIGPSEHLSVYEPKINTYVEFWCNGVKLTNMFADMGNPDHESTLSTADRDFVQNFDNLTGPIKLGTRSSNVMRSSAVITNCRVYARKLYAKEIQSNYLLGCKAEPANCSKLILYAPLNQTMGSVTQERQYGNNGMLTAYHVHRTNQVGGTSAWVQACCKKITDLLDWNCGSQVCDPNNVELIFKFTGTITPSEKFIIAVLPLLNSCPLETNVVASAAVEGIPLIDVSSGTTLIERADLFVAAINTDVNLQALGLEAHANLNTVTIRFPMNKFADRYCGKPFSVCTYAGTTTTPTAYTGLSKVEVGVTTMICCVGTDACNTEVDIEI